LKLDDQPLDVQPGYWASRLMLRNNPALALSHRARFRFARRLLTRYSGKRLLDYGCGDGTLFTVVGDLFPSLTGVDRNPHNVDDNRRRFRGVRGAVFLHAGETAHSTHRGAYDVITCFEVLQCCLDSDFDLVISDLKRLVAANGTLIISMPIECGPALLVKHAVRMVALRRAQQRDRYQFRELLRMTFATERTAITRTVESGRYTYKGFNWRAARARICDQFYLRKIYFSPFCWSFGLLSAQAWLVCEPRAFAS